MNATKGKALSFLSGYLGIPTRTMIAFGDSLNDLSMLQTAGLAVTVSNGWKEIRPFCDAVCLSNEEDGPAFWLNEHYLNGEVIP